MIKRRPVEMMCRYVLLFIFLLCLVVSDAHASSHAITKAFVIADDGGGLVFLDTNQDTANDDFSNAVTTVEFGQSLYFGGEVTTSRGLEMGEPTIADNAKVFVGVNDSNTLVQVSLPKVSEGSFDVFRGDNSTSMTEVASGLAIGVHTVYVYFTATDVNHPLAPGYTTYLPSGGARYAGLIEVVPEATATVAGCDDASADGYAGGWTNGSSGDGGFGAWTQGTVTDPDGAAGFFIADTPGNTNLNNIGSGASGQAWGLFANEAGTGGNDVQIAGARRDLPAVLSTGQVLKLRMEHGGIQSGNLNAGAGTRDGGWAGFVLNPLVSNFPDPILPTTAVAGDFGFGFKGGDAHYAVYDVMTPSGRSMGVPYTADGVEVSFELISSTQYELIVQPLPSGSAVTITGSISAVSLSQVGLFNRNAELENVYFNSLCVEDPPPVVTNRLACDDAGRAEYDTGWTNGANGGFGFEPWSIGVSTGMGAAGFFVATNPPNTDLDAVASGGRAWGMYANDAGGGGIQAVTAYRMFSQGDLREDQTLSLKLEHGGISSVNGEVELTLLGTPTFPNPMGEVFTFQFVGGSTNYSYADNTGLYQSAVPFTDQGLQLDFTLSSAEAPYECDVAITTLGGSGQTWHFAGEVESAPKGVRLKIVDVEDADVFWNSLCIIPSAADLDGDTIPNAWEEANGSDPNTNDASTDDDGDGVDLLGEYFADTDPLDSNDVLRVVSVTGMLPLQVTFAATTSRAYTVDYTDSLTNQSQVWTVLSNMVPSADGDLIILDSATAGERSYRVRAALP